MDTRSTFTNRPYGRWSVPTGEPCRFCGGQFRACPRVQEQGSTLRGRRSPPEAATAVFPVRGYGSDFRGQRTVSWTGDGKEAKIWVPKSSIFEIVTRVKLFTYAEARVLADNRPNGFGTALAGV